MIDTAVIITQIMLAIGAICAVYRVYAGPSVLDRVISVDVILIIVASLLLTDMVRRNHQDYVMFVLITSMVGFLGAVAIARYVVRTKPSEEGEQQTAGANAVMKTNAEPETPHQEDPAPTASSSEDFVEDESTSWFTALAQSGFVPKKGKSDKE